VASVAVRPRLASMWRRVLGERADAEPDARRSACGANPSPASSALPRPA
jgi:hypothetical protein